MTKQKKWPRMIIIISLSMVFLLITLTTFRLSNPYRYVLSLSDGQHEALKMYDYLLSTNKFDILIHHLLNSNDIKTINSVSSYCSNNKLCKYLDVLELKANELYTLKQDTSWIIHINSSYSRETSRSMLDLPNNLRENIEILTEKCLP
ncbi:MAG: hypothetical protein ACEQSR_01165 [Candidatus Methylacidiphilales bacterium]